MNQVKGHWTHEEERQREADVRQVGCPNCSMGPGERCDYGWAESTMQWSHTGRYMRAQELGLVPPFPV